MKEKAKDKFIEADERWHALMLKIGREQTQQFDKNPDKYADLLVSVESVRLLMRWVYHHLVNKKKIKRIEDYSQEEKQEIWDLVLEKCKAKCQDRKKLIEVAKVFCALDYFSKEQK